MDGTYTDKNEKEILLEILKVYQRDCTKKIDNVRFRELYPHDVVAFEDSRAHAEKLEQALRQSTDAEVSTLISGNDAQLCLKKMYQFFTWPSRYNVNHSAKSTASING